MLSKQKYNFLAWAVLVGLIFNAWLWIYTKWQLAGATDLVPLHYTIYFGPDLLDYKNKLFNYPIIGIIVLVANTTLAWFFRKEKLLTYFLIFGAIVIQLLIFLTELALVINYY